MAPRPSGGVGALRSDLAVLHRLWPMLGVRLTHLLVPIAFGSLALATAVGLAATSAWLIARASQMPGVLDLTVAVVSVRALGIGRGTFRYLERLTSHDVALRAAARLRTGLYDALATGRPDAVATLRRGTVLRRWGADVDDVSDVVVRGLLPTLVAAVVSIASVVLIACFAPLAATALAILLGVTGVVVPWLTARSVRTAELDGARARQEIAAWSMTVLDGASELRVSGRLDAALERLRDAEAKERAARDRAARPAAAAQGLIVAAMGLSVLAALLVGARMLAEGDLAAVELAVIVLTPLAAFEGVSMLPAATVATVRAADAARGIERILATAHAGSTPTASGPQSVVHPSAPPGDPGVVATALVVGWPGRDPLLTGLDLAVRPGEAVLVVGPNGSGKSTLLATLAGLLPPVAGQVRIADTASTDLPDGAAAQLVSLTSEDAHIFDTTLLENLRVARGDGTPDEATDALTHAGLGGLLTRLPEGLDTTLGSGGTRISGGERRRVLLARALLSPAAVLLLDEPDEHLDPDTAQEVMRDILALARTSGRGVVVVSHRATDTTGADRVIDLTPVSAG